MMIVIPKIKKQHISKDLRKILDETLPRIIKQFSFNRLRLRVMEENPRILEVLERLYNGITIVPLAAYDMLYEGLRHNLPKITKETEEILIKEYLHKGLISQQSVERRIEDELVRINKDNPLYVDICNTLSTPYANHLVQCATETVIPYIALEIEMTKPSRRAQSKIN